MEWKLGLEIRSKGFSGKVTETGNHGLSTLCIIHLKMCSKHVEVSGVQSATEKQ